MGVRFSEPCPTFTRLTQPSLFLNLSSTFSFPNFHAQGFSSTPHWGASSEKGVRGFLDNAAAGTTALPRWGKDDMVNWIWEMRFPHFD
jgi:hypothetical protein